MHTREIPPNDSIPPESGAITPSPSKLIRTYIEKFVFLVINSFTLLLLFPFIWFLAIPAMVCAGLSGLIYFQLAKAQKHGAASRRKIVVAVLFALAALAIVLIGPFLSLGSPLYVVDLPLTDWKYSSLARITVDGKRVGTLLVVTDPLRKRCRPFVSRLMQSRIKWVERRSIGGATYLLLPSFADRIHLAHNPNGSIVASVWFQTCTETVMLSFNSESKEHNFASALQAGTVAHLCYTANPDTVPWNAVLVPPDSVYLALRYFAQLDYVFEKMTSIDNVGVRHALNRVIEVGQPSDAETARVLTLKFEFERLTSAGNIGRVQALPELNRTFDLFATITRRQPSFPSTPLGTWINERLGLEYRDYEPLFSDKLKRLEQLYVADDNSKSFYQPLLKRWSNAGPKALKTDFDSGAIKSRQELIMFRDVVFATIVTSIFEPITELLAKRIPERALLARASNRMNEIEALAHSINDRLRSEKLPELPEAPLNFARLLHNALRLSSNSTPDEIRLALRPLPTVGVLEFAFDYLESVDNQKPLPPLPESARHRSWWDPAYQPWVTSWVAPSSGQIRAGSPKSVTSFFAADTYTNVFNILAHYGVRSITHDRGGEGELYLPGLFYLCWLLHSTSHPDFQRFASQFEEITSITFESFLNYVQTRPPEKRAVYKLYDEGTNAPIILRNP